MPRYFFHLRNDLSVDDEEGQELPDEDAAFERARAFAIDMAATSVTDHQKIDSHHRIEVADEAGEVLMVVELGDVVTVVS